MKYFRLAKKMSIWQCRSALLIGVLLAACGGDDEDKGQSNNAPTPTIAEATPEPAAERGTGGTLRLLFWQAPTIVNPHLSAGTKDLSASRITYEPLATPMLRAS